MRFHIEMEAAELERAGMSVEEARRRALATFGGLQRYKEEGLESRGGTRIEDFVRDGVALRLLVWRPASPPSA